MQKLTTLAVKAALVDQIALSQGGSILNVSKKPKIPSLKNNLYFRYGCLSFAFAIGIFNYQFYKESSKGKLLYELSLGIFAQKENNKLWDQVMVYVNSLGQVANSLTQCKISWFLFNVSTVIYLLKYFDEKQKLSKMNRQILEIVGGISCIAAWVLIILKY